jgi:long-subunit fatty acid transport protein
MRIAGFSSLGVLCTLAVLTAPSPVRAGGLELLPGGTRSLARGGAVAARPEDAMGLLHNPAGLAYLSGDQMTMDLDFALAEMCVDLYGYYGWGVYNNDRVSDFGDPLEVDDENDPTIGATYASTPLPEICNSGTQFPIPNIAWVGKLSEDFALGMGFVAPTISTASRFGGRDGTIQRDGRPLPTPTRYAAIDQTAEAFAPSVGAAYRIIPQLSIGVNVTLLMLSAKSRVIQNATSGTQPALDWLVDLEAEDYFLPTITVSAHVRPMPGLDMMAGLRWVDDFDGSGKVTFETNTFHQSGESGSVPYRNDAVELPSVRIGLPWALTAGVRYAGMLAEPGDDKEPHLGDPMDTELWDIEADGTYYLNERGSDTRVTAAGDISIVTRTVDGGGESRAVSADDLEQVSVDRHLRDSIALRLGGSFALAPRQLAVHAGAFYENRGVDPAYANIDTFAFARVGFGLGVMWRVGDFDLKAAYGHVFQETIRVAPPPHQNRELFNKDDITSGFDQRVGGTFDDGGTREGGTPLPDPDAPSPEDADAVARLRQSSVIPSSDPRIINAGEYTASFNIISLGATYHF